MTIWTRDHLQKVDILLMKYAHVAVLNLDMTTKQLDFLILLLERNGLPVDLDGLKMSSGEKIECYYCRNLESLKGIDDVSATLKRLMIENSKKLLDYDPISKCTELNSLVFSKCGDMSSLSLLSSLSKLTHFCMLETTVKDGDISQLLSIEKVAITNKQHYNYKLTLSNKWIKR